MLSPGGLMVDGVGYNSFFMKEALNRRADVLAMAPSRGDFANVTCDGHLPLGVSSTVPSGQ